jgi:hypothetical protein
MVPIRLLTNPSRLHDPAGRTRVKAPLDYEEEVLHADACIKNPDHLFDAESSLAPTANLSISRFHPFPGLMLFRPS